MYAYNEGVDAIVDTPVDLGSQVSSNIAHRIALRGGLDISGSSVVTFQDLSKDNVEFRIDDLVQP